MFLAMKRIPRYTCKLREPLKTNFRVGQEEKCRF